MKRQTRNTKRKQRLTRKKGGANGNSNVYTSLLKAVKDGSLSEVNEIITDILNSNIKGGVGKLKEIINTVDPRSERKTPLLYALDSKSPESVEIVQTLLSHGADISKKDLQFGESSLYLAITQSPNAPPVKNANIQSHKELQEMATEKVKLIFDGAFKKYMEELSDTTYENNSQMLTEVKDKLAQFVNERNNEVGGYQTPLMQAARTGNMDIVKILLRGGANIVDRDKFGVDAIWYAKYNKYAKKDVYQMLDDIKKAMKLGVEQYLAALEKYDILPPKPSENTTNTGSGIVGAGAGQ